jgi:hypothetical protein
MVILQVLELKYKKMKKIVLIFLFFVVTVLMYSQVSITSNMTGLQLRNVLNDNFKANNGIITLTQYGGVQDGVTDNTTALRNALEDARDYNKVLRIPNNGSGLTYRIDTGITITGYNSLKNLMIEGDGSVLDFSHIYNGGLVTALRFEGEAGINRALTQNISIGDTLLHGTFSGVNVNDVLLIHSTEIWETFSGPIYKGEYVMARKNYSDTAIVITRPTIDSYSAANSGITLYDMAFANVSNLKIVHSGIYYPIGSPASLLLRNFRDVIVEKSSFGKNQNSNLIIFDSYNVHIMNCNTYESNGPGEGYGIDFTGVQYGWVQNCSLDGARHGFTCGQGSVYAEPSRFLTIENCVISTARNYAAGLDTHQGAEQITFKNNILLNTGFNIRCTNVIIEGNEIYGKGPHDAIALVLPDRIGDFNIRNNIIKCTDTTIFGGEAITTYMTKSTQAINNLFIENNEITSVSWATNFISDYPEAYINNVYFKNNKFYRHGMAVYSMIEGWSWQTPHIKNLYIEGDFWRTTLGYIFLFRKNIIDYLEIKNCYFYSPPINNITQGAIYIDSAKTIRLNNNIFYSKKDCYFEATDKIYMDNNVFAGEKSFEISCDTSYLNNNISLYPNIYPTNNSNARFVDGYLIKNGSLTDSRPGNGEISGIIGATPAQVGSKYKTRITDTDGTGLIYDIYSDGNSWFYSIIDKPGNEKFFSTGGTLNLYNNNPIVFRTTSSTNLYLPTSGTLATLADLSEQLGDSLKAIRITSREIITDTLPMFKFTAGNGNAVDSSMFTTFSYYESFYNDSPDTIVITKLNAVMGHGIGVDTLAIQVYWHATLGSGSATELGADLMPVLSTTTGNNYTSFENNKIPPGVRVWCKSPGVVVKRKPTFLEVTLTGYKIKYYQ